jgi:hypothetical protein
MLRRRARLIIIAGRHLRRRGVIITGTTTVRGTEITVIVRDRHVVENRKKTG